MQKLFLPTMFATIHAGFPSPADDFIETKLDLNDYLIKHPAATYFIRVTGDSMTNAGIDNEDLLIVDRALQVYDGSIVIACVDGEFTLKRVKSINNELYLVPENSRYYPIKIREEDNLQIFGVVKNVIKKLD